MRHMKGCCTFIAVLLVVLVPAIQAGGEPPFVSHVAFSNGTVVGTVTNVDGLPLHGVFVILFPRSQSTSTRSPMPDHQLIGITDSSGQYTIANVDSGDYVAYATTYCDVMMRVYCPNWEYASVWYKDAPDISSATLIHVWSVEPVIIDFVMHKRPIPTPVAISGTVTDTVGQPIAGATVFVSRYWPSPIDPSGIMDPFDSSATRVSDGLDTDARVVVNHARTDSTGRFNIVVLSGGTYVAACDASGFLVQFYREKSNILEADRMTLTQDSAGVDFRLVPRPAAPWTVSGRVHDSANAGIPSRVLLHRLGIPFYRREFVRCVISDSLGIYSFAHVPNGRYVVQAIPVRSHMPSFYVEGSCGVRRWREADTVRVENGDVAGIDVCVTMARVRGAGMVAGHVRLPDGDPVGGFILIARGATDPSLLTYAVTNGDGGFALTGLDEGMFVLSADKVGYQTGADAVATVEYGRSSPYAEFQVSPERTLGVGRSDGPVPQKYILSQNYPNPFNPETMISFSLPGPGFTTLKVFNILGQLAQTIVNRELPAGDHTFRFKSDEGGRELPAGVYFYELQSGKFRTMKKMVLMK